MDLTKIVQSYNRTIGGQTLDVFYKNEFPITIYKKKHPNLSDGELDYIKENYLSPTIKVMGDAIFETQKIFSDKNIIVSSNNQTISDYIYEFNFQSFFKDIYWQQILLDPTSILSFQIDFELYTEKKEGIEIGNEYIPVKPYVVASNSVLHSDKNAFVFKVKGENKFNFIAWELIEGDLVYKYYSFTRLEKVEPLLEYNFGKLDVKLKRKGDGIKVIEDNELVIKSYFSPSETTLSNILFDSVNLSVIEMRTVFPIPVLKAEPCDNGECGYNNHTGMVWDSENSCEVKCNMCEGTGVKNPFSPFNTIHAVQKRGLAGEPLTDPILSWVEPPQGAVNGLSQKIKDNLEICFDYLGKRNSNSDVKGSETALGKMIDLEQKHSTFKMYTQDMVNTIFWTLENWVILMFPLEKDREIKVEARNEFRTVSTAETNAMFTELQGQNAPKYQLRNLLRDYYDSVGEPLKFQVIDRYYLYKSDDMILKYSGMGVYDKKTVVISDNIMKWVDELELSEPINFNEIDRILSDKAETYIVAPIPSL